MKKRKRRDKMIALEQEPRKSTASMRYRPDGHETKWLKESLPFYSNPRGMLDHRIRAIRSHFRHGKFSHTTVEYFCNNFASHSCGGEFLAEPSRLLCSFCEFFAKREGKPSADELVGRHCHVGKLRVEQVCCTDHKERN